MVNIQVELVSEHMYEIIFLSIWVILVVLETSFNPTVVTFGLSDPDYIFPALQL